MITVNSIHGTFTFYENDYITKEIQEYGGFSRPELAMILSFIQPGDTVLDVGAHIGTFAVPMKRAIGSSGRLFAFEANPETYGILLKNLEQNDTQATVFNKGVSNEPGNLYLRGRQLKDRQESKAKNENLNSGADYLSRMTSSELEESIIVDLIKVDDAVSSPVNFIKIDVEGMEVSVLYSAEKIIDQCHPIIYSEFLPYYLERAGYTAQQYEDFLKQRGYHFFINGHFRRATNDDFTLIRIPNPKYTRGQMDFLLIPEGSDRYPKNFKDWKFYSPHVFLWRRFRNQLSQWKKILKSMIKS